MALLVRFRRPCRRIFTLAKNVGPLSASSNWSRRALPPTGKWNEAGLTKRRDCEDPERCRKCDSVSRKRTLGSCPTRSICREAMENAKSVRQVKRRVASSWARSRAQQWREDRGKAVSDWEKTARSSRHKKTLIKTQGQRGTQSARAHPVWRSYRISNYGLVRSVCYIFKHQVPTTN